MAAVGEAPAEGEAGVAPPAGERLVVQQSGRRRAVTSGGHPHHAAEAARLGGDAMVVRWLEPRAWEGTWASRGSCRRPRGSLAAAAASTERQRTQSLCGRNSCR